MIIACETLRDTAGVLKEAQRNSAADAGGKTQIRDTVADGDPRAD